MDTIPPCHEDPDLYFDPEAPEELTGLDPTTPGYGAAMSEYRKEVAERRLKAQLTCLETCPFVSVCRELGRDEEFGVWGGTTPDDRKAVREGSPRKLRDLRSKTGGKRRLYSRQLIGGASIAQLEEMHGTTRGTIMDRLQERVAELSTPSDIMQVA